MQLTKVRKAMELKIVESGFHQYEINADSEEVVIKVDKRINASLMLTYRGSEGRLSSQLYLDEGSSLTFMLKDETSVYCDMDFVADVRRDARLVLAVCELDNGNTDGKIRVNLREEGAYAMVRTACVVQGKKHFELDCIHEVAHTTSEMENYAVVKDGGNYRMKACGKIVKGAHESATHQKTRVLTMSDQHTSEVIPLLLINENDVKASHATTLGQPDENQLYYLQTRGLSRDMALRLLTVGYIMPIAELFEDAKLNEELKNEIEMKVGLHA